ncbi:MAG: hypothetical protein AAGI03_10940 [Pseudomonadota bacterium]
MPVEAPVKSGGEDPRAGVEGAVALTPTAEPQLTAYPRQEFSSPNLRSTNPQALAFTALERDLFEERAAIMEFDGGLARATAERRAARLVLQARRHGSKRTGPS